MSHRESFSILDSYPKKFLKPLFLILIITVITGVFVISKASNRSALSSSGYDFLPLDKAELTSLTGSAFSFKDIVRTDYAKAFLMFSEGLGMEKLHQIDTTIWDVYQSQMGWTLFFNGAIQIYASGDGTSPIVSYYNPYNDIFLITVWSNEGEIYKIVDAELLSGDWVRDDDDILEPIPLWLRDKEYRPETLALSVARSTHAFERVFASATKRNWREKLPVLLNDQILEEINVPTAVLLLNHHLLNLLEFSQPTANPTPVAVCRTATVDVLNQIHGQGVHTLFASADETPDNTVKLLTDAPLDWFSSLKVAAVLSEPQKCQVFLSPVAQTRSSIVLSFEGGRNNFHVKRVDLIDYQYGYEQLKTKTDGGVQ